MSADSASSPCPKCRNKMLWSGSVVRRVSCDYVLQPATRDKRSRKPPRRPRDK